jgi:hypothetical protein
MLLPLLTGGEGVFVLYSVSTYFILLRELEYVVERVGSRAKGDQRCAKGVCRFCNTHVRGSALSFKLSKIHVSNSAEIPGLFQG